LMLDFNFNIPLSIAFWNGDVTWWAKTTGFEKIFKKKIVKNGIKKASIIFVESETARKACLKYNDIEKKIIVTPYPGVDINTFFPMERSYAKKKLGLEKYEKIILWPRGLGSYLNSDTLIRVAKEVINANKNIFFLILSAAGGKTEYLKHISISKEFGINDNFIWKGQVDFKEMPLYYNAADIVLSLSSFDSLPNIMLESMACGVPVIMSDISQIREVIVDKENGFLVNPRDYIKIANKILNILESNNEKIISNGLKLIKNKYDQELNYKTIKINIKNLVRS